ncbi:Obp99c.2 family protein [Megaselia abdita]
MKNSLALILIALTYVSGSFRSNLAQNILDDGKKCILETNLADNFVEMIQKFKFEDEEPIRDYFQCFTDKLDIWNKEEKTIDIDNFVQKYAFDFKKQDVREIVNNCLDQQIPKWIVPFYQCLADSKLGSRVKHAQFMDEL